METRLLQSAGLCNFDCRKCKIAKVVIKKLKLLVYFMPRFEFVVFVVIKIKQNLESLEVQLLTRLLEAKRSWDTQTFPKEMSHSGLSKVPRGRNAEHWLRSRQTEIYGHIYFTLAGREVIFNLSFSEPPGNNRQSPRILFLKDLELNFFHVSLTNHKIFQLTLRLLNLRQTKSITKVLQFNICRSVIQVTSCIAYSLIVDRKRLLYLLHFHTIIN